MDKRELKFLISQGEGYNLEFKESFSDSIGKDICAFANATGGKILVGVTDKGEIKNMEITNKLKSQIHDISRNLDPKLMISLEETDNIILIKVPEGINKPYSIRGKFYLRYGPNSQQLTREEIRDFFQKEGLVLFDEKLNYDFDLKRDLDKNKFKTFLEKAKITPAIEKEEILNNLNLLKEKHIKNAGVLLFSQRITKFFPNAIIICVLYQGKDKYKILDKKEFEADLYSNFQNAFLYLQSHLNTEYIIKREREEQLELPEQALREAILNSIAHRDYFSNASIILEIFSDRVEITNPGGLVKGITKKDLGKKSLSRNNLLFGLMQRMGLVEKVGSGIVRMKKAMKDYGLKLRFDINENWFTIIFQRKQLFAGVKTVGGIIPKLKSQKVSTNELLGMMEKVVGRKLVEKVGSKLVENSIKIVLIMAAEPRVSKRELANILKISTTAIDKHITKLKELEVIERVGPAKGGYWKIVNKKLNEVE